MTDVANPRLWPITVILTRYGGTYEGGQWAAFNMDHEYIPEDVMGDDISCCAWWSSWGGGVGVGSTPDKAVENLLALDRPLTWKEIRDFSQRGTS